MENTYTVQDNINGDSMIKFTSSRSIKNIAVADSNVVSTWLQGDDDNAHKKNLGLINMFSATNQVELPYMKDLFENSKVIEVAEGETVIYDVPVKRTTRCVTAEDTSEDRENPGYDGGTFEIVLDTLFSKGDVLAYDPLYGSQIRISVDHDIEPEGENFRYTVQLMDNDKTKWFPKEQLQAGIEYVRIGHGMSEYGTEYSNPNLQNGRAGTITNEFVLGNLRGVETFYTAKAANMNSNGLSSIIPDMLETAQRNQEMLNQGNNIFINMKTGPDGKAIAGTAKVATALEYFVLMELMKLEAYQLYFQRGAVMQDSDGVTRFNEGVFHQMRRGKKIQYAKPGGILKLHIEEAVAYLFKGRSDIPVHKREVHFKVGHFAYLNMMELYRVETSNQLNAMGNRMGTDRQLPSNPLSGPLDDLKMAAIRYTSVPFPGIGQVSIEHDPTLDYQPFSDRFSTGYYGEGMAHTAFSMVIYDATDKRYSNATKRVKSGKLVDNADTRANVYYVKPEGSNITYGYEQGRMADGGSFKNVQSSMKQRGRTFWANSSSAALVLDVSRMITIEKRR